jgi:hypothetical protein
MKTALGFYKEIFSASIIRPIPLEFLWIILLVFSFILLEWFNREKAHPFEKAFVKKPLVLRWGAYYSLLVLIFVFYREVNAFIYFQF